MFLQNFLDNVVISFSIAQFIDNYLRLDNSATSKETIETWGTIITTIALLVSAIWGYFLFRKNNKIRAADLLIKLEDDYRKHIPVLLRVEYAIDKELVDSIIKVYAHQPLFPKEDKLIEEFESCLRFLYQTYILHRKKLDLALFNQAHIYYLYKICNGEKSQINRYIKDYWPSIYRWFLSISLPFYYRAFLLPLILNEHLPFVNEDTRKCFEISAETQASIYSTIFRRLEYALSRSISRSCLFTTDCIGRLVR